MTDVPLDVLTGAVFCATAASASVAAWAVVRVKRAQINEHRSRLALDITEVIERVGVYMPGSAQARPIRSRILALPLNALPLTTAYYARDLSASAEAMDKMKDVQPPAAEVMIREELAAYLRRLA